MDDGQNSAIAAPLPSEKEIQYEGQTIAYDEHGQAIGIEEETTRRQALFMGVLLFVFGGVFFFIPLGMLISELQYADVEEMFCLIPFFSVFLLVGGALLVGSLFSLLFWHHGQRPHRNGGRLKNWKRRGRGRDQ